MRTKLLLFTKTYSYERVEVFYSFITSNVTMFSGYVNREKARNRSKKRYKNSREQILDWRKRHKNQILWGQKKWRDLHKKEISKYNKEYVQTETGREAVRKKHAKRNRNLGWIKLCENRFHPSVEVAWHHVDNEYVVAIPVLLHRKFYGKNHRERLQPRVDKIYKGE